MNELIQAQLSIGTIVDATVIRILPFGIIARLPNGQRGLIREREISWNEQEQLTWQSSFFPDDPIRVFILSVEGKRIELSVRLAKNDPWQSIEDNYKPGKLVTGVVTNVISHGIFVELEPGVTGLLRSSKLPAWIDAPIDTLFWISDRVNVIVDEVKPAKREISLTLANILQRRWPESTSGSREMSARLTQYQQPDDDDGSISVESTSALIHPCSVVLIEDDPDENRSITDALRNLGYTVRNVPTAEEGLQLATQTRPEVVLSDISLPGMSGLELMHQLHERFAGIHLILMTDWVTADEIQEKLTALQQQGVTYIIKPFFPDELLTVLHQKSDASTFQPLLSTDIFSGQPESVLDLPQLTSSHDELDNAIRNIQQRTKANHVILFSFDTQQRQIRISAQAGTLPIDQSALDGLIYSPIREVVEDRRRVPIGDTKQVQNYVQYLTPLLTFRSCLGLPIHSGLQHHGLFFFYKTAREEFCEIDDVAYTITTRLCSILEQQLFWENVVKTQNTILLGQLARGLVHEMNHQLNPIVFTLDRLKTDQEEVQHEVQQTDLASENETNVTNMIIAADMASRTVQQLQEHVQKLIGTIRLFNRLSVQDQSGYVRVEQIVEHCVEMVRDSADRAKVRLHCHLPSNIVLTHLPGSHAQQILLNLLLNSIQQIERFRPNTLSPECRGGNIHITLSIQGKQKQKQWIYIEVDDDGPGIHRRLWRQIFELGYTTRTGKRSGTGLYVARHLAKQLGGGVSIAESYPFWGTKMIVKLPVRFSQ